MTEGLIEGELRSQSPNVRWRFRSANRKIIVLTITRDVTPEEKRARQKEIADWARERERLDAYYAGSSGDHTVY